MAKPRFWIAIGYSWFCLLNQGGPVARSQQPETSKGVAAPPAEARESALRHEVFLKEMSEYDFYLDIEKQRKIELRREPVMRFTSPVDRHGELYVWTHQGRPEVLGGVFSIPQGSLERLVHEFHSLAMQPLVAGR